VDGSDAETSQLIRDGSGEVSASPQGVEALEREGRLAVVRGGARADLVRELLGECDEAVAGLGHGCQLERHLAFLSFDRWTEHPARVR
jgi:hypothetical protein